MFVASQQHGWVLSLLPDVEQKLIPQVSIFSGVYALQGADGVSGEVVRRGVTMIQATVVSGEVVMKEVIIRHVDSPEEVCH